MRGLLPMLLLAAASAPMMPDPAVAVAPRAPEPEAGGELRQMLEKHGIEVEPKAERAPRQRHDPKAIRKARRRRKAKRGW